jgi:uncharacterized membrane protein YccC
VCGDVKLPGRSEALFSLKAFAAAMIALWIGYSLNLERPTWALLSVYVLAQPLSGAVRSKAQYRLAGTVLGACTAMLLVVIFANAPLALFLAIGFSAIGGIYLSQLDRTPRGYIFLLGGMTIVVIGFSSVTAPQTAFTTAVARTEEILLGIFSITLVDSIVFPHAVGPALNRQVQAWLEKTEQWVQHVIGHGAEMEDWPSLGQLAADAAQLNTLSTYVAYDTAARPPDRRTVRLLHKRMLALLPLLSAGRDLRVALTEYGMDPSHEFRQALDELRTWFAAVPDVTVERTERVKKMATGLALTDGEARNTWRNILLTSHGRLVVLLMGVWQDCRLLQRAVANGDALPPRLARAAAREALAVPYRDKLRPLLALLPVCLAFLVLLGVWTATDWSQGTTATQMTLISFSMMAAQDNPTAGIRTFLGVAIAASGIELLYLFAILPAVHGFTMLAASLALVFVPVGAFIPLYGMPAMMLAALTASFLSLQSTFSADFNSVLNSGLGTIAGLAAAMVLSRLVTGPSVEWTIHHLFHASRTDLARIAKARWRPEPEAFALRTLDRYVQLAPRLEGDKAHIGVGHADPLTEMWIGIAMLHLWRDRPNVPGHVNAAIGGALDLLARHYEQPEQQPENRLLACLDEALDVASTAPLSLPLDDAMMSLAGLRRRLFPHVPRYGAQPNREVHLSELHAEGGLGDAE